MKRYITKYRDMTCEYRGNSHVPEVVSNLSRRGALTGIEGRKVASSELIHTPLKQQNHPACDKTLLERKV
jgi:hypothetical protein